MARSHVETKGAILNWLPVTIPGGGLSYERGGDARRLAYGCKFRIGCSGQDAIILTVKVSFRVAREEIKYFHAR